MRKVQMTKQQTIRPYEKMFGLTIKQIIGIVRWSDGNSYTCYTVIRFKITDGISYGIDFCRSSFYNSYKYSKSERYEPYQTFYCVYERSCLQTLPKQRS